MGSFEQKASLGLKLGGTGCVRVACKDNIRRNKFQYNNHNIMISVNIFSISVDPCHLSCTQISNSH